MVRRLGLGKNNHLTYASLALNPRSEVRRKGVLIFRVNTVFVHEKYCDHCLQILHYENTPIQYNSTFYGCKNEKFHVKKCDLFCSKQRLWYSLEPPHRVMGTRNLCFRAEIRKIMYTPANNIFSYKSGI